MFKHQCGFRKGHSGRHALISLLEKWRKNVDKGHTFGAILTDLVLSSNGLVTISSKQMP